MLAGKLGFFAPSGFTPTSISGLSAWYDASDSSTVTLNGSTVSQWNDKSGNGYHASQSTANNQPTYSTNTRNGLAVLSFDGSNDMLVTSSFADGYSSFTAFAVYWVSGSANNVNILWCRGNDRLRGQAATTSVTPWFISGYATNTSADFQSSSNYSKPVWHYSTFQWKGTTNKATAFLCNVNGSSVSNSQTGTLTAADATNTVLRIGDRSTGGRTWYGYIGELIIYSATLSSGDISSVESYLSKKWGF